MATAERYVSEAETRKLLDALEAGQGGEPTLPQVLLLQEWAEIVRVNQQLLEWVLAGKALPRFDRGGNLCFVAVRKLRGAC